MNRLLQRCLSLLFIFTLLAGCNNQPGSIVPSSTPPLLASATPAAPAATSTPTALPGRVILVAPPGVEGDFSTRANALLKEQASKAGLRLDLISDIQPENVTPEVKAVILLAEPANLKDLLAAAPQTQFGVVSSNALEDAGNLSLIHMQAENQAFVAGYLSVLLSDDWRSAGLIESEKPDLQQAFANGGRYYCGMCAPGWPLNTQFPLVGGAAAPGDAAAWVAAAQNLFDNGKAEVFYLSAQASQPELYTYLAGREQVSNLVRVVGSLPPPDALRSQWAATVSLDPLAALKQAAPDLMAGKKVGTLEVPVSVLDVNPDLLSPGRLADVQSMMADLAKGLIQTQSVPAQ